MEKALKVALAPRALMFVDFDTGQRVGVNRLNAALVAEIGEHMALSVVTNGVSIDDDVSFEDWPPLVKVVKYDSAGPHLVSLRSICDLMAILGRERPDTVHCYTYNQLFVMTAVKLLWRRPLQLVFTDHNSLGWKGVGRLKRLLCLAIARPHFISLNRQQFSFLSRHSVLAKSVSYIPNGVDIRLFDARARAAVKRASFTRLLYPAALYPWKGHATLIEAVRLLVDRKCEVQLRLAGDGPQRTELEERVRQERLEGTVVFLGYLSGTALAREMARADIGVFPSYSEMLPLSCLEMMAAGLPVVATRVGGLPDVIQDGRSGYLVEPGDAPQLADRIEHLIRNTEAAQQLGLCASSYVREHCSVRNVAEQLMSLYRMVSAQTR
jgi:glycosyltransferase involved in cell wall biosynthesis